MSRDCVQGSKCYNCSGVVSILLFRWSEPLVTHLILSLSRATEAGTAPSLKSELATLVAQKDTYLAIARVPRRLTKLLPKNFSAMVDEGIHRRSLLYHTCLHSSILSLIYLLLFVFFSCSPLLTHATIECLLYTLLYLQKVPLGGMFGRR